MARIVIVDDDPDILFVAQLALKRGRHEVISLSSGADAIAWFEGGGRCDLVICDRMMPEKSGLATLAELRRRPGGVDVPFVFLTAKAQRAEVEEGLRLGACRYLTKPFEPRELLQEVNRILAGGGGA